MLEDDIIKVMYDMVRESTINRLIELYRISTPLKRYMLWDLINRMGGNIANDKRRNKYIF